MPPALSRILAPLLPLALLFAACSDPEGATGLAIENVTVIDAVNGVRPGQTVVVDGDRIVSVEPAGSATEVAESIDGTGRFLIPGLWDMHVHLTYEPALTDAMPELFLSYGITSVRDTGGLLENLLPVVQRMRAEGAAAPRVFFSGPLMDGEFVVYDGDGRPEIGISNPSPEAARANVATLAEAGVDFIKIYELVSPEVFAALVAAADERNLPIAAHVPLSMAASEVAPRVDSMEHLRNVEMDCGINSEAFLETRREILEAHEEGPGADLRSSLHTLQRLPSIAEYDEARCRDVLGTMTSTIQVPTLRLNSFALRPPFAREDWLAGLDRAPAAIADPWRAETEQRLANPTDSDTTFASWSLRLVGMMHEAGVPIGAGTDTPINYSLPGFSLHSELEMLVRAGLPPIEALRAATVRPAEFFGLEGEMGTIETGRRADLVLLSANPLDDISNTRRIETVISRGQRVWENAAPR